MRTIKRPDSLVTRVANTIRHEIDSGRQPPQSRLPTEFELAERLNVSRSVIREAVSQLKADGVLVSRRGAGSFVSDKPTGTVFRLPEIRGRRSDLEQLFEMRLWVEVQSASIAAVRRSAGDLERMSNALDAMDNASLDLAKSAAADVAFHRAIAAACKNEYFLAFLDFLGQQLAEARREAWENSARMIGGSEPAQAEHLALFKAITQGDPEAAARTAAAHLEASARRLGIDLPKGTFITR
ncbi:FadR/GntR family transcriptional regulator [Pseudomonas chlororaphis]|uniref:FadR/GntR family transcriptional regulator n=2 Tax=Pseudomonas chlororaphis TaxID=587753 RepID=UPI00046FFD79|nr:FadR/GntR family transcriptional regulator [Pseudomonas chlororaphis]